MPGTVVEPEIEEADMVGRRGNMRDHRFAPASAKLGVGVKKQQPIATRRLRARPQLQSAPTRRGDDARSRLFGDLRAIIA